MNLPSTKTLESNMIESLDKVTIVEMCRLSWCPPQFTDAYKCGLTGKEVAWANKKYCGHHCMPSTVVKD
ncbi:hypothetical protein BYT27DRAFT_7075830 [Phlegmacium glaucopus]|nr:hypothetical protein BYT27DRAFT_7075830 [Phlegmacium glaucopus]